MSHNLDRFFLRAERIDWTSIDFRPFFSIAERIPRPQPTDWVTFGVAEFFLCAQPELVASPSSFKHTTAGDAVDQPLVLSAVSASAEQHLRKLPTGRKVPKKFPAPDRQTKDSSAAKSTRNRLSGLRGLSSQAAFSVLADSSAGAFGVDDLADELDEEEDEEPIEISQIEGGDKTEGGGDATAAATCISQTQQQQPTAAAIVSTGIAQSGSSPNKLASSVAKTRQQSQAEAQKDATAGPSESAAAEASPKRKPRRRGGRALYVARKKERDEKHEQYLSHCAEFANRRHDILKDAVTYRQSGPWRIEEATREVWASAYAPHVAAAYPSPPSGPKPTRQSDTQRKTRHGRVKPFICKQQYPTQPVTVVGHDMRIPEEVRNKYREQRRAQIATMNKRRDLNRNSDLIDHLLVPLKAKLEDVSPALMEIVAEYEEAEAEKVAVKAAAVQPQRSETPASSSVRPPNVASPPANHGIASSSRTPSEARAPPASQVGAQSPAIPVRNVPRSRIPISSAARPRTSQAPRAPPGPSRTQSAPSPVHSQIPRIPNRAVATPAGPARPSSSRGGRHTAA